MSDLGYGFIYITTNHINGKKYIGQRKYGKDIGTYLGSGILLNKAIIKYGRENFSKEIIDSANTLEELNELEIYYIKLYTKMSHENSWLYSENNFKNLS